MSDLSFIERDVAIGKWSCPDIVVQTGNYKIIATIGSSEWNSKILELDNLGDKEEVQLELLSTPEWSQKTGTVLFGFEGSTDGGQNWFNLCSTPMPIGFKSRFGKNPALGYKCVALPGMKVRIYVNPSVAIRLSATGTVN